jgi:hypothetical protein
MADFQQWGVCGWGETQLASLIARIGGGCEGGEGEGREGREQLVIVLDAACMHVVLYSAFFLISPFCCRGLLRYKKGL